ncbi:MAG: hypothetical protein GY932_14185, partial [Arcobacter sp.]|nr:hypothetical protein [Arcobacter sp.]
MKFITPTIFGSKPPKKHFLILLLTSLFFSNLNAQQYPPNSNLTHAEYNPPVQMPDYLSSFTEENFGN